MNENETKSNQIPLDEANIIEECGNFVSRLSLPGFWGGSETIRAVNEIHRANVIVFNEKGDFYLSCGFNQSYDRSIFLAYRLNKETSKSGNVIRNHYDSVCAINEDLLYKCATILTNKIGNQ